MVSTRPGKASSEAVSSDGGRPPLLSYWVLAGPSYKSLDVVFAIKCEVANVTALTLIDAEN